ncbi:MAG: elongation factor 1-beta [Candidatus Aenigmarchaeota archaeon]|nr:elongation factor 1-beta [Candidatus Aenigmarchaeota archaeon]
MAKVEVTLKIMPEGPGSDLKKIAEAVKKAVEDFGGKVYHEEVKPLGFGIKEIYFTFLMDESTGDTEPLEEKIVKIAEVQSVKVTNVTRALG